MKRTFDSIILDIDGTIWNTTGVVATAWNKAIDLSGYPAKKVVAEDLQKEFGKPMNEIAMSLWPNLNPEQQNILLSHCVSEEHIAIKNWDLDITYPNVIDTIKEMSQEKNFFIVSNCQNGYIELMMEKTGLTPYIKDFECFGRTGKGKSENIQLLIQRNQLVTETTCYIGDTMGDLEACRQAKIPFIHAAYGFGQVPQEFCFHSMNSFDQLKQIIG